MRRVLFLSVFIFLVFSCKGNGFINPNEIDHISFYCMSKGMEFPSAVTLSRLLSMGRDTVITDKGFINEFVKELNSLSPSSKRYNMDLRKAAFLCTNAGDTIKVLFGEYFGIELKGVIMNDSNSLFALIDERVYAPHPNYYWFPNSLRDFLHNLDNVDSTNNCLDPHKQP